MSTTLAITGGIACGKSYCLKKFESSFKGCRIFSCDEAVSKLLTDPVIVGELASSIGEDILGKDQEINRPVLRARVFENSEKRIQVEEVIHPQVLRMATSFLENSKRNEFVLMEIPLLYEVKFPIHRDFDIVVGCSVSTQIDRLEKIRKIKPNQAKMILEAQLPIPQKIDRTDFVVWNDGGLQSFDEQIQKIVEIISSNTGDDRRN